MNMNASTIDTNDRTLHPTCEIQDHVKVQPKKFDGAADEERLQEY